MFWRRHQDHYHTEMDLLAGKANRIEATSCVLEVCLLNSCLTRCFPMSAIGLRVIRARWRPATADTPAGSAGVPGVGGDRCQRVARLHERPHKDLV